jgi:hypothetical protein
MVDPAAARQLPLNALLRHAVALSAAVANAGGRATIELADFAARIDLGGRQERWPPRFVGRTAGGLAYTESPMDTTVGFAGWLPYAGRRWPEGAGKAAFKRHADACGLATPAACTDPAKVGGPFLVKRSDGSFGRGQRGPFLAWRPDDPDQQLAPGEYYENFIPGLIAKAWCWADRCVALELQAPPVVTGDGRQAFRELAAAAAGAPADERLVQWLATFFGLASPDDVLPEGRQALAHYVYGSSAALRSASAANMLEPATASGLTPQFERAAALCAPSITRAGHPPATLYTLDAVVDEEGTAWFLEMNCNPLVHPDAYAAIVASTLHERTREADAPEPAPA